MFEVPKSASPEGFRGTHRSGTLLQGGYCNDIALLKKILLQYSYQKLLSLNLLYTVL